MIYTKSLKVLRLGGSCCTVAEAKTMSFIMLCFVHKIELIVVKNAMAELVASTPCLILRGVNRARRKNLLYS